MIKWEQLVDRHCFGMTEFGKVCIRLNRNNEVVGLYTMWNSNKIVPSNETEKTLDGMKTFTETLISTLKKGK